MPAKKEVSDPKKEGFKYQLDLLKMEFEIIDKAIARLDDIPKTTKNFAIVMRYSEVNIVYIGLSLVSIIAGLAVLFAP